MRWQDRKGQRWRQATTAVAPANRDGGLDSHCFGRLRWAWEDHLASVIRCGGEGYTRGHSLRQDRLEGGKVHC